LCGPRRYIQSVFNIPRPLNPWEKWFHMWSSTLFIAHVKQGRRDQHVQDGQQ
jgi:hypothetical protein